MPGGVEPGMRFPFRHGCRGPWARALSAASGCADGAEGRKALLRQSRPADRRSTRASELSEQGCTWKTQAVDENQKQLRRRPCQMTEGIARVSGLEGPYKLHCTSPEGALEGGQKKTQKQALLLEEEWPCAPPRHGGHGYHPVKCTAPEHPRWKA